MGSWHFYH